MAIEIFARWGLAIRDRGRDRGLYYASKLVENLYTSSYYVNLINKEQTKEEKRFSNKLDLDFLDRRKFNRKFSRQNRRG